ncbi:MAG: hypothetical protein AAF941_01925 [Pseudomonadota bacterium]
MIPTIPASPSSVSVSDPAFGTKKPMHDGKPSEGTDMAAQEGLFASALEVTETDLALQAPGDAAIVTAGPVPVVDQEPGSFVPPSGKPTPDRSDRWVATLPEGRVSVAQSQPVTEPVDPATLITGGIAPRSAGAMTAKHGEPQSEVRTAGLDTAFRSPTTAETENVRVEEATPDERFAQVIGAAVPASSTRIEAAKRKDLDKSEDAPMQPVEESAIQPDKTLLDEKRVPEREVASNRPVPVQNRTVSEPRTPVQIARAQTEESAEPSEIERSAVRRAIDPVAPAQQSIMSATMTPASGEVTPAQIASTQAAPVGQSPITVGLQPAEIRSELRGLPQVEQAIEQLTEARETGRASRPELTLRHAEFGFVNMRLEAAGGDLRATLASRDPGFVPAIQAALNERVVGAASETAGTNNQRGQEQGSNSASSGWFGGSGGGSDQRYGSSPGSAQGFPQPRLDQQGDAQRELDESRRSSALSPNSPSGGEGGVFA